jgi:transposase
VNQIFTLAEKTRAIEKSKLGRAIQYLINQRSNLLVFLSDPQVALSNNVAERSIKTSVIGRKNWLFSTSQRGLTPMPCS